MSVDEMRRQAEAAGFTTTTADADLLVCEIRHGEKRASAGFVKHPSSLPAAYGGDWWGTDLRRKRAEVGLPEILEEVA